MTPHTHEGKILFSASRTGTQEMQRRLRNARLLDQAEANARHLRHHAKPKLAKIGVVRIHRELRRRFIEELAERLTEMACSHGGVTRQDIILQGVPDWAIDDLLPDARELADQQMAEAG